MLVLIAFWVFVISIVDLYLFRQSLVVIVFIVVVFFYVLWNKDRKAIREFIRTTGIGVEGEEKVVRCLQSHLGDEYFYIKNFQLLSARIGDFDGILLGPKGLIVFEVKNWHGMFKIACGEMYRKVGHDLFKLYKNPFLQVEGRVKALDRHLKRHHLAIPIRPLVVLIGGNFWITGKTGVFITSDRKLVDFIKQLPDALSSRRTSEILSALNVTWGIRRDQNL